ncbi:MAG: hypothetical protein IT374_16155 [Polyangiaceae bacterium]|nr:hypothetical protein [Polyangiaceae bacterium]
MTVDDDDDDDVATVIGPARAFVPHLYADTPAPRAPSPGPSATVQINDGRAAPTLQLQALDASALVAPPPAQEARPRPPPPAPTMLVGDRARQAAGTPTGFMIYLAVCGVLTATGVALLVVLRTQGRF